MQFKFVCRMQLKDGLSYVITGLIEVVHSIQECLILLLARIKLDHQSLASLKRIVNGDINMFAAQSESNGWGTLLPGFKDRGFRYPYTPERSAKDGDFPFRPFRSNKLNSGRMNSKWNCYEDNFEPIISISFCAIK